MTKLILSISSDIGAAAANYWIDKGFDVAGTYRTYSQSIKELEKRGAKLFQCNLLDIKSIDAVTSEMLACIQDWSTLLVLPGTMTPIANFENVSIDIWRSCIDLNFTNPLRMVHSLLSIRKKEPSNDMGALIMFSAGGGVQSTPISSSAYTTSKIALIKFAEILDAEIPDLRVLIFGPGWVKTKIHNEVLNSEVKGGPVYQRTAEVFKKNRFTEMKKILNFFDWAEHQKKDVVGGRNFSIPNDQWGNKDLEKVLEENKHMYKLRRSHNEWPIKGDS
ncbi:MULTISPECIES: SDR family NAD(P)-dependent oxidoreductase [unclassified Polynucleobacter]|uniref:SDR family NAD(P)-dependent oxidoreductase n=1 Tax=unclassified Polynucleobacter TaxID=2640945 RepID=UPI0008BE273A|nr:MULTISPECIES: SDR family NAD(P)-dependent oxidoreductase [unclassified Polynucleobacter]OHC09845.1 MAG: hypothetical protein A2X74_05290 [Polynucleobacter sp. GWA2_45_21]HBK42807.1 hypothetical protein [Polynucleobacter sp.]